MVDFHSHVLPGMDDGAENVETSLRMLRESVKQGVNVLFATSHFYAYEELCAEMEKSVQVYPDIYLGAEVLFFPGMSGAEELKKLTLGSTNCLLVEPPMMRWSDTMLDEIEQTGKNLSCVPVIAHIDRYMRMLDDDTLFERVKGRRVLIQVNASFFIHEDSRPMALKYLSEGRIHFMGSDCHNMTSRAPNLGAAAAAIRKAGVLKPFSDFNKRIYYFLGK